MTSNEKIGYYELSETVSEYKWTLYNFSSFNKPNGKSIRSPTFLSNGIKWYFKLFPNGEWEDDKEYISLFLCCLTKFQITVECEFIMSTSVRDYKTQKFKHTFSYDSTSGYGYPKFLNRNTVLTDIKDKNDILNIVAKISFSNTTQETNYFNLQEDFSSLLKTKEYTDVTLVACDGSEHKVHKAILACRSKVFSAMFQHNMKESQDHIVKINDVDCDTLEGMLHFVYTGELVENIQDISKELLIVADKYELHELKRMCINYLDTNMNNDNVLDLMEIAETYNINELKLKAKKYFLKNHKEILSIEKRKNLKDLSRDIVEDLLCDLSATLSV